MPDPTPSEQEIEMWLARVALGDHAALKALYAATSVRLFSVVLRLLKDRSDAEQALQDVYLRVWDEAGLLRGSGMSPLCWLINLARHQAIDILRRRTDQEAAPMAFADAEPRAGAAPDAEAETLASCLDALSPDRARALRSAYLDAASYADLAAHLDMPITMVRPWLRGSLLSLRACLSR